MPHEIHHDMSKTGFGLVSVASEVTHEKRQFYFPTNTNVLFGAANILVITHDMDMLAVRYPTELRGQRCC